MLDGLIVMIQLSTSAFPTLPRLTHIMSCIDQQYRNLCPFCSNCCVPESITHLLVECSCWDHYRMRLEADIPDFFEPTFLESHKIQLICGPAMITK